MYLSPHTFFYFPVIDFISAKFNHYVTKLISPLILRVFRLRPPC